MNTARYLWSRPAGRLALLTLAATMLLLSTEAASGMLADRLGFEPGFPPRFGWPPYLLLAALPRRPRPQPYEPLRAPERVTPGRPDSEQSKLTSGSPDGGR